MRPAHWVKNLFVAAPVVFAPHVLSEENVVRVAAAVICFCLAASGVYALNDWCDRESDRNHPLRRTRPLAQGMIVGRDALFLAAILATAALAGAWALAPAVVGFVAAYGALNVAYSFGVKSLPMAGPATVVAGFLMRIGAGAAVIDVPPSPWILVVTGLLAALLVAGKRRADLATSAFAANPRLDHVLYVLAAATLLFYVVYAVVGPQPKTLYSVPLVAIGLGRYLQRVVLQECPQGPTELILSDRVLLPTIAAWVFLVLFLVHG